ncbi:hypothetical protein LAZ67_1007664 [Cordylochernes scorpioides]|uniref:Transposase n=1 Tax=Cordylochernes scorpioides TaxID=51811 RepID=A0ABY6K182_9ARAC|nr:hypothetical protein LAZ67_1007664 [Cordylochernes scorpioides]
MPGHRKRRQFKQTDAFTRCMVIGLKRAGWSIRKIAADTHLGASTVHRLWRRWLEQGNVAIYRNVGATRVTSARVDRRILRQAVAAPQATCTAILQHVQDTLDHSISTRTISRRLVANGLHSCRPLRRLPLTPPNRRQRLEWCRARSTWMTEWHRVVFSDESRFCLSSDSRRVRVWRRRGERSNPAAIVERPTVRQRGIMVWGAIAYDSRSPSLHIQGTMTAQRYVDDVLRPVTLPYLQGVPNALYQQDNAQPHTARISQQALQDVQMLPWPPYSPDLSPIEHVWDIFGRRLHALPQPRSEDELWQMVEREWRAIPQDAIRTLIDSLPRRVAACIAVLKEDKKQESSKMETNEIRAVIKYLCKKGKSPKEIYKDMVDTLRKDAPSYSTVKKGVAAFKLGRISTEDEHRPGRPVESVTQENIDKIHDLVMLDRIMTVRKIEETLGIPKTTVDRILREHLGLRKLSARWVPKLLTPDQKAVRRKLSSDNLALFEVNPEEFVNIFVIMDETWAHHFTPESKQQSMQWRYSGSPPPGKPRQFHQQGRYLRFFISTDDAWRYLRFFISTDDAWRYLRFFISTDNAWIYLRFFISTDDAWRYLRFFISTDDAWRYLRFFISTDDAWRYLRFFISTDDAWRYLRFFISTDDAWRYLRFFISTDDAWRYLRFFISTDDAWRYLRFFISTDDAWRYLRFFISTDDAWRYLRFFISTDDAWRYLRFLISTDDA